MSTTRKPLPKMQVYMTEEEKRLIRVAAGYDGMTPSKWARQILVTAARQQVEAENESTNK